MWNSYLSAIFRFLCFREDYEGAAPPNSFIHVDDFPTVKDLAEYLIKLDKNDEEYGKYLKWKSIPDSMLSHAKNLIRPQTGFAALCGRLKQDERRKTPYAITIRDHLDTWWYGEEYNINSKQFSVCFANEPSGIPLGKYITMAYSAIILLLFLLVVRILKR